MNRKALLILIITGTMLSAVAQNKQAAPPPPQAPTDSVKTKKPTGIADKVKGSKKIEGLFTLYQDTVTGSVQLYIKKAQLGKEYIYQSFSISGPTQLFLNQSMHRTTFVFKVQKAYDKLEFSRVNTSFYYDENNPVSKTKNIDKPEAVFLAEKSTGEDSAGYLIQADGFFISEKMDAVRPANIPGMPMGMSFSLGGLKPLKSKYSQIRSFLGNTDVVVDLAYDNPGAFVSGGRDITDQRNVREGMKHKLI